MFSKEKNQLKELKHKIDNSGYLNPNLIDYYNRILESMISRGYKELLEDDKCIDIMFISEKYYDLIEEIIKEESIKTPNIFKQIEKSSNILFVEIIDNTKPKITFKCVKDYKSKIKSKLLYANIYSPNNNKKWLRESKSGIIFCSNTKNDYVIHCYCPIIKINSNDFVANYFLSKFWPNDLKQIKHYNAQVVKLIDLESFFEIYLSKN